MVTVHYKYFLNFEVCILAFRLYEIHPWTVLVLPLKQKKFIPFFPFPPSFGIAPCVGTVGTVHVTPTLDTALLFVVHLDRVTTTSSRAGTDL